VKRKSPLQRHTAEIEDILWLRLRALRERGWVFRKDQHFRTFLLPFVEHEALLVVELSNGGRNIVRDRLLAEAGYTVLRFDREEAIANLDTVTDKVLAVLKDRA
jgi:very-short-patch-repair endonuclease